MVRVTADTGTQHLAINLRAACLCVLVGFDDDSARAFTERDTAATVEGGAGLCVQRMERKESRIRHRCECVRTAGNDDIRLSRADEVAGIGNADGARRAGVCHVGHNAARTEGACDLIRNRGDRHFTTSDAGLPFL